MKFQRKSASRAPALALTSMLDVIFLLLCFFVTVSVFSQWENEISIQLPTATTAQEPDRLPGEIVVNLSKDGEVTVNGRKLGLGELKDRLARISKFYPGQPVIIRADRETRYDALVDLIDACRAADALRRAALPVRESLRASGPAARAWGRIARRARLGPACGLCSGYSISLPIGRELPHVRPAAACLGKISAGDHPRHPLRRCPGPLAIRPCTCKRCYVICLPAL